MEQCLSAYPNNSVKCLSEGLLLKGAGLQCLCKWERGPEVWNSPGSLEILKETRRGGPVTAWTTCYPEREVVKGVSGEEASHFPNLNLVKWVSSFQVLPRGWKQATSNRPWRKQCTRYILTNFTAMGGGTTSWWWMRYRRSQQPFIKSSPTKKSDAPSSHSCRAVRKHRKHGMWETAL